MHIYVRTKVLTVSTTLTREDHSQGASISIGDNWYISFHWVDNHRLHQHKDMSLFYILDNFPHLSPTSHYTYHNSLTSPTFLLPILKTHFQELGFPSQFHPQSIFYFSYNQNQKLDFSSQFHLQNLPHFSHHQNQNWGFSYNHHYRDSLPFLKTKFPEFGFFLSIPSPKSVSFFKSSKL
ncbi:hypothetical protein LguiA_007206 [Lonicera macranthoides]